MAAVRIRDVLMVLRSGSDRLVTTRFLLASALAVMAAALTSLAPLALKRLIDAATAGLARSGEWMLALYVAASASARVCQLAQAYLYSTADQRLERRLCEAGLHHLQALPLTFHLKVSMGGLIRAQALAMRGVRLVLTHAGFTLLPSLVQMLLIVGVVARLFGAWISLALGISMTAYGFVFAWGVVRLGEPTRRALNADIVHASVFADTLANIEAVKSLAGEARTARRYAREIGEAERLWRDCFARRAETGGLVALVFTLSLVLVLGPGLGGLGAGKITVGSFVLLNAYLLQIVAPLEAAGFAIRDLSEGLAYFGAWTQVLRTKPEMDRPGSTGFAKQARLAPLDVEFRNVQFSHGAGRNSLDGVSFLAAAGSVTAIVGASGAGKTSLHRLILRHYAPQAGDIRIGARPLEEISLGDLRRGVGLVSQDIVLFNDTLEYNLRFARPDASQDDLSRVIRLARLDGLIERLPEGLATPVGERGHQLSGGERQRVLIARALLQEAPILILDEATSALDPETEAAIWEGIGRERGDATMVVITHRLALAARADLILVLVDGRIAERGRHRDLLQRDGVYAHLWRGQTGGEGESRYPAGDPT
ncbi:MAG: ATP-binding cassette domain-containing protein [Alphaproteobacteria bacterium]|nr:ATP-binding cassette domain-containing protein [Alphaproteobacteria bacterium]